MTEKLLRACLKEAELKSQEALIIWPDWRSYEELESDFRLNKVTCDAFSKSIEQEKTSSFSIEWNSLIVGHVFGASVKEMVSSEEFFQTILETCKNQKLKGPVSLFPLNTMCEAYP